MIEDNVEMDGVVEIANDIKKRYRQRVFVD